MYFPEGLDVEQAQAILSANRVQFGWGADLLDLDGNVLEDLTPDLLAGEVSHGNYDSIHGKLKLSISRELDWGAQLVRPWMRCTARAGSFTVPLGAYLLGVPDRPAGRTPRTWQVSGADRLLQLDRFIGATHVVTAGTTYLDAAKDAAVAAGIPESLIRIDSTAATVELPADRTWALEDATWLRVINDLLAEINYRAAWFDAQGVLQMDRYIDLSARAPEWTHSDDPKVTMLAPDRSSSGDFRDAPNRWVFILDDPAAVDTSGASAQPVVYETENLVDGPTSQAARGGQVITSIQHLAAPDLAALQAQGDRIAAEQRRVDRTFAMKCSPLPLHGHMDVARLSDSDLGFDGRCVCKDWSLQLGAPWSDMSVNWRAI